MSTFKTNNIQVTGDGNIIIQDVKDSTIHLHVDDKVTLNAFLQKANKELKAELLKILESYRLSKLPKALSAKIPTLTQDKIVGRKAELADLQQRLFNHSQVLLVNGLGGIGKTTLAQVYVGEHWDKYQHIVWVSQLSDNFQNDLVNTEGLLQCLGIQSEGKEVRTLFLEILRELKKVDKRPNLMVIDNAEASLAEVYDYLPKQPNWHILVTSRHEIRHFEVKELGFLSKSEAVELFFQHYQLGKISETAAQSIMQSVDRHTLTIEILAKTAQRRRSKIEDLLEAIQKDLKVHVYVRHSTTKIDRVTSYLNTIFRLNQLEEAEIHLLQQFCGLPSEFHSYDLLEELLDTNDENFPDTLADLCAKGWLLQNKESDQYKMHRIVKEVVLGQVPPTLDTLKTLIGVITSKLEIDQNKDNPVDKFQWIVFGESILELFGENQGIEVAVLQNNLAVVLRDHGDYVKAKSLLEKAIHSSEQNLGENHLTTAVYYSNLGIVLQAKGDYIGAKALLERAMFSTKQNLGTNHPNTASSYSNLALVLQDLGDYTEAKALLEKAVFSFKQNFGESHPKTILCYANLGIVFQALGDYVEAITLLKKAMYSSEKNFGVSHPTTAIRYSKLALVLKNIGDYTGAKTLFEKAMFSYKQNFGENHPTLAVCYSNLGRVLKNLGDYAEAKALLEKAMYLGEKNFGASHPATAVHYTNLASVLQVLGDYVGAKTLLEKAMILDEGNFGESHPTTAIRYSNLATVYFNMKELKRAVTLLEKAYKLYRNHFGEAHPNTKTIKGNLDYVRSQMQ